MTLNGCGSNTGMNKKNSDFDRFVNKGMPIPVGERIVLQLLCNTKECWLQMCEACH